jgi:imidazolonepropionase-like amidohydrolase
MNLLAALAAVLLTQSETVVFKGGRIVSVAGPEIENGMVVVKDGKIAAFGVSVQVPAAAKVIELSPSSWILPGFIDAHSHLGSSFDVEESTEAMTPDARAVDAFTSRHPDVVAAMSSGVTLVAIAPGNGNLVGGQVGVVRLNGERYDRALLRPAVALKASIGAEVLRTDREPTSRTGAVALLRKRFGNGGAGLPALPIFLHASTPGEIESALELEAVFGREIVLVHARPEGALLERLAERKLPIAFEPLTVSDRKSTLETPGKLAAAGVRLAFVSDAPSTSEAQLRVSAAFAVKYGMDRDAALRALTIVPAEILGLQGERGSIATEKAADLVVWSGDPLSLRSRVELVMIDGHVTWRKAEKE